MELDLTWKEEYKTGVQKIDDQHQCLFALTKEYKDRLDLGMSLAQQSILVSKLVNYTLTHFKYEESLMSKHNYPDIEHHKADHNKFGHQLDELSKRLIDNHESIGYELVEFLSEWLVNHILGVDYAYIDYVKGD